LEIFYEKSQDATLIPAEKSEIEYFMSIERKSSSCNFVH